jgi:bifunctional NMN adenylyltransferase/nudix hydrolase
VVLAIKEYPEPSDWSERLEKLLRDKDGQAEFILYGTPAVLGDRYTGNWKTEEMDPDLDSGNPESAEGFDPVVVSNEAFRKGIIYAYRQLYPQVYPTVDIAVYRESDSKWLLVRKGYNNEWRFPGGFSDPEDETFENAAARELNEETGIITGNLTYEMSLKVDDWRYRDERDKIITTLFSGKYKEGEARASDDIAEVKWASVAEMQQLMEENQVADEHRPLFSHLLNK